jgi:hypothetical protein
MIGPYKIGEQVTAAGVLDESERLMPAAFT